MKENQVRVETVILQCLLLIRDSYDTLCELPLTNEYNENEIEFLFFVAQVVL